MLSELDTIHMDYGLKQIDWNLSHNKYEFDNDDESCVCACMHYPCTSSIYLEKFTLIYETK